MGPVLEIATKISTPLMLAGFLAGAFFLILRQVVAKNIFPQLTKKVSGSILVLVINRLFVLSLVAMVLGFAGFVLVTAMPAEKALVKPPDLPGDTGWVFAGYFDTEREFFTEGPYVSIVRSASRGMRRYVEVGDTIQLNVARKIYIVDFKKTGTSQKLVSPINKGVIDQFDETGVVLPAETQLIVRDVSEGKWPDNVQAALWLRVVHVPSLVP